jgi:hypothetical protein
MSIGKEPKMKTWADIDEICAVFDARVLTALGGTEKNGEMEYWDEYIIGDFGDLTVGIQPFYLTPGFRTIGELEAYANSVDGQREINMEAGRIFADWDASSRRWRD